VPKDIKTKAKTLLRIARNGEKWSQIELDEKDELDGIYLGLEGDSQ
jgi:hypothetical protein